MTAESFIFDVAYDYSESVLPLLSYLSVFHYMSEVLGEINTDCLDSYEILCRHVSLDDAYYEACELHFILFCAYYIIRNENAALITSVKEWISQRSIIYSYFHLAICRIIPMPFLKSQRNTPMSI